MGRPHRQRADVRLAAGFAGLLALVVGVRFAAVVLADGASPVRIIVSGVVVAVFVGIPAAYGLRGLLRSGRDDRD